MEVTFYFSFMIGWFLTIMIVQKTQVTMAMTFYLCFLVGSWFLSCREFLTA